MVGAARFHGDVDRGVAQIHSVIGAVVGGLDDVGAMLGQNSGEAMQGAGIIGQMDAQAHQASVFDQAALDDAGEQCHVDVAAADQHRNFFAG